jgi:hypothetical protein
MRTFLFFAGSTVGSLAFQITVAIYPQQLQGYAWAVKWLWLAWALIWITWLILHPKFVGGLFSGNTRPESKAGESAGVVTIKDSLKQEFNPVFSPKIEIGIPPTSPPRPLPPPTPPNPQRQPNVHYKSVRVAPISIKNDSDDEFIFREVSQDIDAKAVIVCYRNDPIVGVKTATNVSAHLTLRNKEGAEIGTGISKACWLNTSRDSIDLESGVPEHVVLLVHDKSGILIPWKRWVSQVAPLDSGFITPSEAVGIVDVEIVDSRGEPLVDLLSFDIFGYPENIQAKLRPPS